MRLSIPDLSLVVLVGPSGSGKSTFARRHFRPTEVVSSDVCRGLIADDENEQAATPDAFALLHFIVSKRLASGRLTVVDATSVKPEDRARLIELAREYHVLAVALVFDLQTQICVARNQKRADRDLPSQVVRAQSRQLRRSLRGLAREGFRQVVVFKTEEEADAAVIERRPLWPDRRTEAGPFDIIGDVHGCFEELLDLLERLGYRVTRSPEGVSVEPALGRKAVFLGDLVDRGPATPSVLRLVMDMVRAEAALCVPGNHDVKLLRKLRGRDVRITHGLAETLAQLEGEAETFRHEVAGFLDGLVSHYVLDGGRLVVAHAGLKEPLQGRASGRVREFALYGETTGETDEFGLPVRYNWAADYRGRAMVVYGHTPVAEPEWLNRTLCVDTGCVYGGALTALRYPEREIVQVPARRTYFTPVRPTPSQPAASVPEVEARDPHLLDVRDVLGKRIVSTRLLRSVTIREENAVAALEVMSRYAVDPRWLIYLPPTMSPSDTCRDGDLLEHPSQVFAYFRHEGVPRVVCQEKHMGSRALIVAARDSDGARRRFGFAPEGLGVITTRTGRPFFASRELHGGVLQRVQAALARCALWDRLRTDWIALDAEIMPWSVKAQELLRAQYAPAGCSGRAGLGAALAQLSQAATRDGSARPLLERFGARAEAVERYVAAYRRYCWPVKKVDDLSIAPFHVLASEGHVHVDRDHLWHLEILEDLCRADEDLLRPTAHLEVDLTDLESEARGVAWWERLTEAGGEGMVVKPLDWVVRGLHGVVQPAVKCRGREYLRIIYGPEYTLPENLERLRRRSLSAKRSLALRELALGIEALHRFVEGEPLYRVHECVFGVLALESEPVDPRL